MIAGDVKVNLANVELLTIQIRLLVCSIDKAEEIGMNWWRTDPHYAEREVGAGQMNMLTERLDALQAKLDRIEAKTVTGK